MIFALGLIDTGYRFGGKNPEAGLDCSGMVSYIYNRAAGSGQWQRRRHRPPRAARSTAWRPASRRPRLLQHPQRPFSHVGIYIGDDRFVHAPSSSGRVRIDQLDARYYAQRFETARTYFD
ncbi:MAG: NlpC/P60 family protein [Candidatus Accumulibacter necessarius]